MTLKKRFFSILGLSTSRRGRETSRATRSLLKIFVRFNFFLPPAGGKLLDPTTGAESYQGKTVNRLLLYRYSGNHRNLGQCRLLTTEVAASTSVALSGHQSCIPVQPLMGTTPALRFATTCTVITGNKKTHSTDFHAALFL